MDVLVGYPGEPPIEPVKESSQRTVRRHPVFQQQRGQRRAQRQRVERGQNDGNGNRQRELLVKPPRDAGDEYRRHKDRRQNQSDGHHRPGHLLHGLQGRILWRHALPDMPLDGFHHYDGVIHHQSDGQDQAEEGQGIDGKAKQRKEHESADERDRHRQQRNERRAPALKKDIHNNSDQQQRLPQGRQRFLKSPTYCQRGVERNGVIQVLRKSLLQFLHLRLDPPGGVDRIGARQLVNGQDGGGFAVQPPRQAVNLGAQLDARHVLEPHHRAVRILAYDDFPKLLLRDQPALGDGGIGAFLPRQRRRPANLPGRIDRVLAVDRSDHLAGGDVHFGQLIRFAPETNGVLTRPENIDVGDALHPRDLVNQIDVGVVGQERRVIRPLWRIERHQQHRRRRGLQDGDSVILHCRGQLRSRLLFAQLSQHLVDVWVRLDIEVDHHAHDAVVGVDGIHVVHVVHPAHLLFDGRGNGLLHRFGVRANEGGLDADFWRDDAGELGNRQGRHRNQADQNHENGDDHGHDGAVDEKAIHYNDGAWVITWSFVPHRWSFLPYTAADPPRFPPSPAACPPRRPGHLVQALFRLANHCPPVPPLGQIEYGPGSEHQPWPPGRNPGIPSPRVTAAVWLRDAFRSSPAPARIGRGEGCNQGSGTSLLFGACRY